MIPEELKPGDPLEANWLNRLVRAIVARTVNAGPGLLKTQTPAGTTLSLAPQPRAAAPADFEEPDFPWKASVANTGTAESPVWTLSMTDGIVLVVPGAADGSLSNPLAVSFSDQTITAGGVLYLTLAFSLSNGVASLSCSAAFGSSLPSATGTLANGGSVHVPIAYIVKPSGEPFQVQQRLSGAFAVSLASFVAERGVTGYDVAYNVQSGVFSKTPIYGWRKVGDTAQQSPQTVFTAVDEEI